MRITNRITNGRRVAVFGYGSVGRGVAAVLPRLQRDRVGRRAAAGAAAAGAAGRLRRPGSRAALREADIMVTVTGAPKVITADDLAARARTASSWSAPGTSRGRSTRRRCARPSVVESVDEVTDGITTLNLRTAARVHVLTHGHMVNLAGPRPLGNSIESMDLGFTLQARCLEAVAAGALGAELRRPGAGGDRCAGSRPSTSNWRASAERAGGFRHRGRRADQHRADQRSRVVVLVIARRASSERPRRLTARRHRSRRLRRRRSTLGPCSPSVWRAARSRATSTTPRCARSGSPRPAPPDGRLRPRPRAPIAASAP